MLNRILKAVWSVVLLISMSVHAEHGYHNPHPRHEEEQETHEVVATSRA